jgi:hypothetical protein
MSGLRIPPVMRDPSVNLKLILDHEVIATIDHVATAERVWPGLDQAEVGTKRRALLSREQGSEEQPRLVFVVRPAPELYVLRRRGPSGCEGNDMDDRLR